MGKRRKRLRRAEIAAANAAPKVAPKVAPKPAPKAKKVEETIAHAADLVSPRSPKLASAKQKVAPKKKK